MSLFHHGKELFQKFGFTVDSEFIFSDYCKDLIFPYLYNIRFTSKSLIFTDPKEKFNDIVDDWIELDGMEFHPWYNILGFQSVRGAKIVKKYDKQTIADWLSGVNDPAIGYPHIDVRKGHIAFIVIGKPRSIRSKGGRASFQQKIEQKKENIKRLYPTPFDGKVEVRIDVFSKTIDSNDRPDVDRFSSLIVDGFKGVAYQDDRQIVDLRPRIFDVSNAFRKLECRAEPMGCFELMDLPLGSVFPLAMGETEYYVVRINYCG